MSSVSNGKAKKEETGYPNYDMNVVSSVGEGLSSTESSNSDLDKISPGPSSKKFKFPVYIPMGGGEPVVETGARPPPFCSKCRTEHHSNYCPQPCTICFSPDHSSTDCTFLSHHIPRGTDYNRDRYYIICPCGNPFNEEKWACAFCSGTRPRLRLKNCDICNKSGHHLTHECTEDKEYAAFCKAIRDHDLLFGWNTK